MLCCGSVVYRFIGLLELLGLIGFVGFIEFAEFTFREAQSVRGYTLIVISYKLRVTGE